MEQLGGIDRAYLGVDSDAAPADFVAVVVLDPSAQEGRHDFARVRDEAIRWVPSIVALTRRPVSAPLGLVPDRWIVDPDFDVDRHLHRVALPAPGGLDELRGLVLALCSRPLPRDRPLWQMWFVEGVHVDGVRDGTAILLQVHHAAIDGAGAVGAFGALFGTESSDPVSVVGERVPSSWEVLLRGLPGQLLAAPVRAVGAGLTLASGTLGSWRRDAGDGAGPAPDPAPAPVRDEADRATFAPHMLFNRQPPTSTKSLALRSVPLEDIRAIAREAGATVNDVVLAVVAGALRGYLLDRGELPEHPLRAACPVNVRNDDDGEGGNAFTAMVVPLPTDLEDPTDRLRAVSAATTARKPSGSRGGVSSARAMLDLVDTLPSAVFSLVGAAAAGGALTLIPPTANLVVSNVRGPESALAAAGARVTHLYARTMAGPGLGVMIHCASYDGHLEFGITAMRDLVPDPQVILDDLEHQVALLRG